MLAFGWKDLCTFVYVCELKQLLLVTHIVLIRVFFYVQVTGDTLSARG